MTGSDGEHLAKAVQTHHLHHLRQVTGGGGGMNDENLNSLVGESKVGCR